MADFPTLVRITPEHVTRERPAMLRALGRSEPALLVTVDGEQYERVDVFKHDSWAATAAYSSADGRTIVCKFNRRAPIGWIPMGWLGRFLGYRERYFLQALAGVPGIPGVFREVKVNGRIMSNVVAHEFIPGKPLSLSSNLRSDFFENVKRVLAELHDRRIAYFDLHKQENVIVGEDGSPYLIDFQVSLKLPRGRMFTKLFCLLRDSDLYHVEKHRWLHRHASRSDVNQMRPWWIKLHRLLSVPLRTIRRRFLVAIRVRSGKGYSSTEVAVEVGLRRENAA